MTPAVQTKPIFGDNRFNFGRFCANCNGGVTFSTAAERWATEWDDFVAVSEMVDPAC